MHRTRYLAAALLATAAAAPPAYAQDTPPGYKFCGWWDFNNGGGWTYEDPGSGVYLRVYARNLTCKRARRNQRRVNYDFVDGKTRVRLRRYRCKVIEERHEYLDARCVRKDRPKIRFRWQTGA